MEIKELTKSEEQVMQVLWKLEKAYIKDILLHFDEPKPAYNTVSTIVRILENKGFIDHEAFGKTHQYFAKISEANYKSFATNKLLHSYFGNSVENMFSYFIKEQKINMQEADEILRLIEKLKK